MNDYLQQMIQRFWQYKAAHFSGQDHMFERANPNGLRPPVFNQGFETGNLLLCGLNGADRGRVVAMIAPAKRQMWFRSMRSSQALTQSVFGTLAVIGRLDLLAQLETDDGEKPFRPGAGGEVEVHLELEVNHLGEPQPTSKDVAFRGRSSVTVECKLTEPEIGPCSAANPPAHCPRGCDGSYSVQMGRASRCYLTEIGVRYWEYVPLLFHIDAEIDHNPCPLNSTYQLVRNLLATCVSSAGGYVPDAGVVTLYDDRNPSFQEGGDGWNAFTVVREMLCEHHLLQRATWLSLAALLHADDQTHWLATALNAKYGFLEGHPAHV
jgi:hypothetical protein